MARVTTERTVTITITITPDEAQRMMSDFNKSREPSIPGKSLYTALIAASAPDDDTETAEGTENG